MTPEDVKRFEEAVEMTMNAPFKTRIILDHLGFKIESQAIDQSGGMMENAVYVGYAEMVHVSDFINPLKEAVQRCNIGIGQRMGGIGVRERPDSSQNA